MAGATRCDMRELNAGVEIPLDGTQIPALTVADLWKKMDCITFGLTSFLQRMGAADAAETVWTTCENPRSLMWLAIVCMNDAQASQRVALACADRVAPLGIPEVKSYMDAYHRARAGQIDGAECSAVAKTFALGCATAIRGGICGQVLDATLTVQRCAQCVKEYLVGDADTCSALANDVVYYASRALGPEGDADLCELIRQHFPWPVMARAIAREEK